MLSITFLYFLKCVGDRPTDRPTDGQTDIVLYRAAISAKNNHLNTYMKKSIQLDIIQAFPCPLEI